MARLHYDAGMKWFPILLLPLSLAVSPAEEPGEKLVFDTEWKGERIELPPTFAPKMKMEGIEEIRFAPGMFKPGEEDFFSYVFVFAIPAQSAA